MSQPRIARLPRNFVRLIEQTYSADLSGSRVLVWPECSWPADVAACAVAEGVHVGAQHFDPVGDAGRRLLAHELAHVVQKRRGRLSCPTSALHSDNPLALEFDADMAASAVFTGQRYSPRFADRSAEPRYWDIAGHFATTNYVLLAAGVKSKPAERIAFYSQLPDLVDQLDAKWAGYDLAKNIAYATKVLKVVLPVPLMFVIDWASSEYPPRDTRLNKLIENSYLDIDIQKGLHCLTGRSYPDETYSFANRLLAAKDEFELGLAIHSFGDSYAHRIQSVKHMFPPFIGHAARKEAPDHIHDHPQDYFDFTGYLYDLIRLKMKDLQSQLSKARLQEELAKIVHAGDDPAQIKKLRASAGQLMPKTPMSSYTPNAYSVDEDKFHHTLYKKPMVSKALGFARAWSSQGKTGKPHIPQGTKTYTVKPGDTLGTIAAFLYGDANAWKKLYEANKGVIGPNANAIKVGQVLSVP